MKLGTLKEGGRDGTLVVVSRNLETAVRATGIAQTLQAAIDDWSTVAPALQELSDALNAGTAADAFPFDPDAMASPLPRAYQWVDGSAYLSHAERVRRSRGAELPESAYTDPLMYQGGSDHFLPPTADIPVADEAYGIDFEGEVAAIMDDIPMGASPQVCADAIRLLLIVNDVSLRGLIPAELGKGFGFLHGKPPTAFAPVAVTPDELGDAWRDGSIHLPLLCTLRGEPFGHANAGEDIYFTLADLAAHAAKTRPLTAGTIVGSGTVSNRDETAGYACIAEIRAVETVAHGEPKTGFMKFGDRVRIEMTDADGNSIFGAIDQKVVKG